MSKGEEEASDGDGQEEHKGGGGEGGRGGKEGKRVVRRLTVSFRSFSTLDRLWGTMLLAGSLPFSLSSRKLSAPLRVWSHCVTACCPSSVLPRNPPTSTSPSRPGPPPDAAAMHTSAVAAAAATPATRSMPLPPPLGSSNDDMMPLQETTWLFSPLERFDPFLRKCVGRGRSHARLWPASTQAQKTAQDPRLHPPPTTTKNKGAKVG
jgi:hypothetical protein